MSSGGMTRRDLLRRGTAASIAVGGVGYGSLRIPNGPVQNGQAIAPLIIAGAVGASVAAGWLLRETEVIGSNPPAEGLTRDALISDYHSTARARQSTNGTKIFDTAEILDGAEHVAYADGKIAAIDALNDQKQESEVIRAGKDAVDKYFSKTVITNLLRTWNEAVNELHGMIETGRSHPEISPESYLVVHNNQPGGSRPPTAGWSTDSSTQYELPDGSTIEVKSVHAINNWYDYDTGYETGNVVFDPTRNDENSNNLVTDSFVGVTNGTDSFSSGRYWSDFLSGGEVEYLHYNDWSEILNQCEDLHDKVTTGLDQWVSGVYGNVQSGELDTSELLTPREQAELTSENEGFPQAIADLQALNVSVDLEREAEVYLPDIDATIYGQLGYSGDTNLEVGTVDPNATDADGNEVYPGSFYITYDISQGEGTWGEYNEGVDGGVLTFTSEPYENTLYHVQTTAGEAADVTTADFTDNGDGTWTVDLSSQLDNSITNVETITFSSETEETQYETIRLDSTFEIRGFTDSDGNEYNKSNFERSEPQTDDNYITQEEWEEQQKRNQELIEKYEDSQQFGGGGIDLSALDGFGLPGELVAVGIAAVGAFLLGK